ncbi:hypothetical protein BH11BAC3_BH11BAC3_08500 [soil metagenome]
MKKYLVFIAIIITVQLQAQTATTPKQQAVQQTIQNMFEALSNRDAVALKNYCAPDMRLIEYGQPWTLDTLIDKAITQNKLANFKRSNHFDFIYTTVNHKTAWASYYLTSEFTIDTMHKSLYWIETVVLVEVKGNWQLKHLHSTLIK